jgi:hypothetical protein
MGASIKAPACERKQINPSLPAAAINVFDFKVDNARQFACALADHETLLGFHGKHPYDKHGLTNFRS